MVNGSLILQSAWKRQHSISFIYRSTVRLHKQANRLKNVLSKLRMKTDCTSCFCRMRTQDGQNLKDVLSSGLTADGGSSKRARSESYLTKTYSNTHLRLMHWCGTAYQPVPITSAATLNTFSSAWKLNLPFAVTTCRFLTQANLPNRS